MSRRSVSKKGEIGEKGKCKKVGNLPVSSEVYGHPSEIKVSSVLYVC